MALGPRLGRRPGRSRPRRIFALLTLLLLANQVATGLALTIFGIGLSALVGKPFLGMPLEALPALHHPFAVRHPAAGATAVPL